MTKEKLCKLINESEISEDQAEFIYAFVDEFITQLSQRNEGRI